MGMVELKHCNGIREDQMMAIVSRATRWCMVARSKLITRVAIKLIVNIGLKVDVFLSKYLGVFVIKEQLL